MPALAAAVRRLERRARAGAGADRAGGEGARRRARRADEARAQLERALRAADHDPRELEGIEERLFAIRAVARKYNVPVDGLQRARRALRRRLGLIEAGAERLAALEAAARGATERYRAAAAALSDAAASGGRQARQGGQRGARAAEARARPLLHRDRHRAGGGRPARHRPRASSGCATNPGRDPAR